MSAVPNIAEDTPLIATNGTTNGVSNLSISSNSSFKLHDTPIENFRPLKVIVIGAGYSGIYCGIRVPERLRNVELVIYEKNEGVGGTWWENRCVAYSFWWGGALDGKHLMWINELTVAMQISRLRMRRTL
jgi:hypothetical protein